MKRVRTLYVPEIDLLNVGTASPGHYLHGCKVLKQSVRGASTSSVTDAQLSRRIMWYYRGFLLP
jgi:hypothetical protein